MRGNGLAFAVGVRSEIDRVHSARQLFQLGKNFFFAGNDHVFGGKLFVRINTESALGQIFYVTKRGLDGKSLAQIFLDGLRLRRRFDND